MKEVNIPNIQATRLDFIVTSSCAIRQEWAQINFQWICTAYEQFAVSETFDDEVKQLEGAGWCVRPQANGFRCFASGQPELVRDRATIISRRGMINQRFYETGSHDGQERARCDLRYDG